MKRVWMFASATAVALTTLSIPAMANGRAPAKSERPDASASAAQVGTTVGSIKSVDVNAPSKKLQLASSDGKIVDVQIDPVATSVWRDGEMIRPKDLQVGQQVRVRHAMKNGQVIARSIEVMQSDRAALPATTTTTTTSRPAVITHPVGSPATSTTTTSTTNTVYRTAAPAASVPSSSLSGSASVSPSVAAPAASATIVTPAPSSSTTVTRTDVYGTTSTTDTVVAPAVHAMNATPTAEGTVPGSTSRPGASATGPMSPAGTDTSQTDRTASPSANPTVPGTASGTTHSNDSSLSTGGSTSSMGQSSSQTSSNY